MGTLTRVVRAQGAQCPVHVNVGATVACEKNRTNPAPVCPQKTVYGANVIVFEGILAFANKELLKVSLPQVAAGPGGDVLRQDRRWPWVPLQHWGRCREGSPRLLTEHCVPEASGRVMLGAIAGCWRGVTRV